MKAHKTFEPKKLWPNEQVELWTKYANEINQRLAKKYSKEWIIK